MRTLLALVVAIASCGPAASQGPVATSAPPLPAVTGAAASSVSTSGATAAPALAWRRIRDIPTPRSEVAVAEAQGFAYVLGGFGGPRTNERYDPRTDRWEPRAALPIEVDHAMAAGVVGRRIYLMGGNVNGVPTSRAFVYVSSEDSWREIASMPGPRSQAAAVARGATIYLVGGWDGRRLVSPTYAYDTESDRWRTLASIPTPRDHLAAAELDAKVCAVGGRRLSLAENLAAFECYDDVADRWETLADAPTARGGVGAAVVGRQLLFLGGEQPAGTFRQVELYDGASGKWTKAPDLPTPRHGLAVIALDGIVYALSGGPTPGGSQTAVCEALALR